MITASSQLHHLIGVSAGSETYFWQTVYQLVTGIFPFVLSLSLPLSSLIFILHSITRYKWMGSVNWLHRNVLLTCVQKNIKQIQHHNSRCSYCRGGRNFIFLGFEIGKQGMKYEIRNDGERKRREERKRRGEDKGRGKERGRGEERGGESKRRTERKRMVL
jgi:hypothetical protein